jgi:ABC-type multidrug transport system fused ATPase/permease subunit
MGLSIEYRALREACQTDVDGSSIDTLEELARHLGLDAEQVMLPLDHVFLSEARALPAIVVTLSPGGRPHFVVLWRRFGPFVQIMDPATGRHVTTLRSLISRLYQHTTPIPGAMWREWAGTDEAVAALRRRMTNLGAVEAMSTISEALEDPLYGSIAALDAATRAVEDLVRAGAMGRGRSAGNLVTSMVEQARAGRVAIPDHYFSVRPNPDATGEQDALLLTGAVLLRFRGWRQGAAAEGEQAPAASAVPPDLAKALCATEVSSRRTLLGLVAQDPLSIPLLILGGLLVATAGRIVQALVLRALLDLGRDLGTVKQRAVGMLVLAAIALLLLLFQVPTSLGLLGIGRRFEVRLRKAYFEKLPKTEDRYFQSRLASDMASRCHAIQSMRTLPGLVAQAVTISLEALATAAALVWVAPAEWRVISALAAVTLLLPMVAQWFFFEPDMRIQTHAGALNSFILNGLLGLAPIRIHGAERSLRRGQEALLVEWTRNRYSLQALTVAFEALFTTSSYALVVCLVYSYLRSSTNTSLVLLLVFWALRIPTLGQRLLVLTRSFPSVMNRVRRLLELIGNVEPEPVATPPAESSAPLFASEATGPQARAAAGGERLDRNGTGPQARATRTAGVRTETMTGPQARATRRPGETGVAVALEKVRVKGGGHVILDKVSLRIAPGEHVAIVGPSGAGKSTLVGLLLGWLRPARGEIRVDGRLLDQPAVEALRRITAWVDPAINLWNESLLDNLRYGNDSSRGWSLDAALKGADMLDILEALPEGLQTTLGEGGSLVSGGQGQRVRLARAMLRSDVRLAILDEPFRGLDRERRARLLEESRALWDKVTLLCVTHDVAQTQEFDRVLVVEGGRVVEDGRPPELMARETSRYAQLVRADEDNHRLLWRGGAWRRWRLADGRLQEQPSA